MLATKESGKAAGTSNFSCISRNFITVTAQMKDFHSPGLYLVCLGFCGDPCVFVRPSADSLPLSSYRTRMDV